MRHLIAQQLVIELVRMIAELNRLRQQAHLLQISAAFVCRQIIQFGSMAPRNEKTIALVKLPHAQKSDAVRETPDDLGRAEFIDRLHFPTKWAVALIQGRLPVISG